MVEKRVALDKMEFLCLGVELINFPAIESPIYNQSTRTPEVFYYEIDPEEREAAKVIVTDVDNKRGNFISVCSNLDNLLGKAISSFFFDTDSDMKKMFHAYILDTTIFSFSQRKKVLQQIMEKHPDKFKSITKQLRQELFSDLDKIIDMRNAFAHGKIIIDYNADNPIIRFYNSKKNKEDEKILSSKFFTDLENQTFQVALTLSECIPDMLWDARL